MQEDDKILKVITRIFMAIFIVIFITIMIRFFAKNVLVDMMNIDNPVIQEIAEDGGSKKNKSIQINWNEEYPIKDTVSDTTMRNRLVNKYNNIITNIKSQIENYSSEYLFEYEKIVELAKIYENTINWNLISVTDDETPIEIEENNWTTIKGKKDYTQLAYSLIEFDKYLKQEGVNLLYVQAPLKIDEISSENINTIYKDYSRENIEQFINIVKENDVETLDLYQEMKNDNINFLSAYFKTDHHWLPETGVWAAGKIVKRMNEVLNMNIDSNLYNKNIYNIETYENSSLGSFGRKVTLVKANKENFDIVTPNFDNNLTVKIPDLQYDKTGTLRETFIDIKKVNLKNPYDDSPYSAYGYGDHALIDIKNNNINSGDNILILKDSFANVVTPYLSLGTSHIFEVDKRYFNGSIKDFIKKNDVNKVIILYYPGSLYYDFNSESQFDFE